MIKQYMVVVAALMSLIACRKNPTEGTLSEGMSAVRFHSAGQAQIVPEITKSTVPMAQGATVGVLAYQRSATGAADVTADVFKDMKTYAAGVAGALTPSLTDDSGSVTGGNADGMELHNGTYDFYAYSPALKIEPDHYTVKGVGHYTDFTGAVVPAHTVSRSTADVELLFEHKCSKVRFNVVTAAGMDNSSLAADSVLLYKMAVSPAADFVLGGDITPTLGNAGNICKLGRVEAAADNKSTSVWEVLLPKSSGVFDGDFHLKINDIRYVLKARDVKAMSFGKGIQYVFTAVVRQGSIDLLLNVASWDAVSGSVDAGEGGQAGSGSWDDGGGETGGDAGTNHGIVIGSWDHIDWNGSMGGNPDPVTGAIEVGSWTPAQVIVDAGGTQVADIDSWVKKTLAAQAGADHGGVVDGWGENGFETSIGESGASSPANCYMVKPGEQVAFDARIQGNGGAGAVAIDPQSVQLLWQEGDGVTPLVANVTFADGIATVTANSADMSGNAVVAAYSGPGGTGEILWSWHIWVTDYAPDGSVNYGLGANSLAAVDGGQVHTYGAQYMVKNPGKVMMDRNLGATAALYKLVTTNAENYPTYGLFYQWGRKDPIPKAPLGAVPNNTAGQQTTYNANGQATGYPICTAGPVALGETVKNPHVFYCNGSGTYDWNSSPNNALWGDGTTKSVYDPCPAGWRIAPNGTWDDLGSSMGSPFGKNSNWNSANVNVAGGLYAAGSVAAFYPVAGNRLHNSGVLSAVGSFGYSWSSSPDGVNGINLGFNWQGLGTGSSTSRGFGLQVRCIQE